MHLHGILDTLVDGRHASSPYYNCTFLPPRLTSHPPPPPPPPYTSERIAVYELYLFPTKMHIFESNNKNTISTSKLNCGNHWDFNVSFCLYKSINLKVPNLTAPLSTASAPGWGGNRFEIDRSVLYFTAVYVTKWRFTVLKRRVKRGLNTNNGSL